MINIKTNLDRYSSWDFPQDLKFVPRVGEKIKVLRSSESKFNYPYPNFLEVQDVTYTQDSVEIDLWYDKNSHKRILLLNKEDI